MIRTTATGIGVILSLLTAGSVFAQCQLQWQSFGTNNGQGVRALLPLPNGDLVVGGEFSGVAGVTGTSSVAVWDGGNWSALGSGLGGGFAFVAALAQLPNGDIVAGGGFTSAGGTLVLRVARWNGASWSVMGSGFDNAVYALEVMPNGDLVAGGEFTTAGGVAVNGLARWDGSSWSAFGPSLASGGGNGVVYDLELLPNGDLVVGGLFTTAGGVASEGIVRWDGSGWNALGSGLSATFFGGRAFAIHANGQGDLIVGGSFSSAGGVPADNIAKWDGAAWSALGPGLQSASPFSEAVRTVTELPGGDLVAGGSFVASSATPIAALARFDGSAWTELAGGASLVSTGPGTVGCLLLRADGSLVVGGLFDTVGTVSSDAIAALESSCGASVVAAGSSCSSSGGNNSLVATTLPWAGTTFAAEGTGLPSIAIVAMVYGLGSISVPLSTVLPQGQVGCDLQASADYLQFAVTTNGSAASQLFLPNSPSLAGQLIYHQFVPLELNAQGNIVAATVTNVLAATIGAF